MNKISLLFLCLLLLTSCGQNEKTDSTNNDVDNMEAKLITDPHSYARPSEAKVVHLDLSLEIKFDEKKITALADYTIEAAEGAKSIAFDTKGLKIHSAYADKKEVEFILHDEEDIFGQKLEIPLAAGTKHVSINYETTERAEALQWLAPEQTADKKMPFLFTQSQAILARTWLPCQDGPGIRFTYNAKVKVPKGMLCLMSAENPTEKSSDGMYSFTMKQPIPSYLMALTCGDIEFKSVGKRTGVYAEPSMLEASVYEFADMEKMLIGAEKLYGPYVWEKYDLIVLPPSFPFGGMENPRLTFATPTIIAGDRSLTALVAHELAHSWSGNLVTNATWNDFWLNEGFTVYFEQRIMEELYGRELSEMLALLSYEGLVEEVKEISDKRPSDTHLKLDLDDRNPDDGLTAIAYDKGYLFLRMLEETYGRSKFDVFLREYFDENAFKIMTTEAFMVYLDENLLDSDAAKKKSANVEAWIYGPGLPENTPVIKSDRLINVEQKLKAWLDGKAELSEIPADKWVYQEWQHFVQTLPNGLEQDRIALLDETFNFTQTGNNEVLCQWLIYAINNDYRAVDERLEQFLMSVGRRKFLTPIYAALLKADPSKARAKAIYKNARQNYHAVSTNTLDAMIN